MDAQHDFGTNTNLNFPSIDLVFRKHLLHSIDQLGLDLRLDNIQPIQSVTGKGYTGRSDADIIYQDKPLGSGKLVSILFRPGDGTGNTKGSSGSHPALSWTPREKAGEAEFFIPIGTGYHNFWFPSMTSLAARVLQPYTQLTTTPYRYERVLLGNHTDAVPLTRVTYTFNRQKDFGKSHVVVFDVSQFPLLSSNLYSENFFQVGSFLAFPERDQGFEAMRRAVHL